MGLVIRRCATPQKHWLNVLGFKWWSKSKWFISTHGMCSRCMKKQWEEYEITRKEDLDAEGNSAEGQS